MNDTHVLHSLQSHLKPMKNYFYHIPDDIWLSIFQNIAIEDSIKQEAQIKYESQTRYSKPKGTTDLLLSIGLCCKQMHRFFESMFLFTKAHGFQQANNQLRYYCAFRFQNAMEVIVKKRKTHNYHSRMFITCVLSIPCARWKHLMVYDEYHLDTKIKISKHIYCQPLTTYKRREDIAKEMMRFASNTQNTELSHKIIGTLQQMLSVKPLNISYSNQHVLEPRDPIASAHDCIESFVEHLFDYLRSHRISFHMVSRMIVWGDRVQNINNEYIDLMEIDSLRGRVLFFIHSPIRKVFLNLAQKNEYLQRATFVLFCLAILLRKPKKEIERMAAFLYFHDSYNIFQESDILSYAPDWIVAEPSISFALMYITRETIRHIREHELNMNKSVINADGIIMGLDHYIHQLSTIISMAYKFQIEEPLVNILYIGLNFTFKRTKMKVIRILSRHLEDIRVSRNRNQRISHLLWDIYKKIDDKSFRKEKKFLHLHPFLSPGIFYRFTKDLKSIGLTKRCSLTCLGIHELPTTRHPFIPTLRTVGEKFIYTEIEMIHQIFQYLDFYNCSVMCQNIGNISTIIKVLNYRENDMLHVNKAIEIIEWVIKMFPICPRRFDHRLTFDNDPLDDFKTLYQIILSYMSQLKRSEGSKTIEKLFIASAYDLLYKIVGWGSYLWHDKKKYKQWENTLMQFIPRSMSCVEEETLILLIPKICEIGCLKLTMPVIERCHARCKSEDLGFHILKKLLIHPKYLLTIQFISKNNDILFKKAMDIYTSNESLKKEKSLFNAFMLSIVMAHQITLFVLETYGSNIHRHFKEEILNWMGEEKASASLEDIKKMEIIEDLLKT